ncbi:MAG: hypothetical protein ACAI37_27240 [Chthoniobacter sp.]
MRYERSDKLFEEAGRDLEKFDELLRRAKKQRDLGSAVLNAIIVVCVLLLAWLLHVVWSLVYPLWRFAHSGGPLELPTIPHWFEVVMRPGFGPIYGVFGMIVFCSVLQHINAVALVDQRVKLLLLVRGLHSVPNAESPATGR